MIQTKAEFRGYNHAIHITAVALNQYPGRCPVCLHEIGPIDTDQHWLFAERRLEIVFRCPRPECEHYFVARYSIAPPHQGRYSFSEAVPLTVEPTDRTDLIRKISPDFAAVCRQAEESELRNLKLICGPGYRKALEFLIKDYVISLNPDKTDEIKKMNLAKCIADFVENDKVRDVAQRAIWLGNDETHYLRKWDEKDMKDLKTLIELTVHWIEMETLTEEAIKDMPEGR